MIKSILPKKVTLKIAAIPNRTQLISENRIGLEDGGDIFGFPYRFLYILALFSCLTVCSIYNIWIYNIFDFIKAH